MKNTGFVFLVLLFIFWVGAINGKSEQSPKLDCKKLALKMAKAFEERDARTLSELTGQEASKQ